MSDWLTNLWPGNRLRPWRLAKLIDRGDPKGQPVILLHGIGRTGNDWQKLTEILVEQNCHVVAYDLLGFGASPKPEDIDYTIDEHANAVIASIQALHLHRQAVVVGHSLGALVAVRVARLRPDLVQHLVLYEMPLYEGLPEKRRYRARLNVYFRFYKWAISQNPTFDVDNPQFRERVAKRLMDMELTKETWQPLIRTVKNSIMQQTAADDIKHLHMASDIIYGSRDMFVIRGKVQQIFGQDTPGITAHIIKERHMVTPKASKFLAERVMASLASS